MTNTDQLADELHAYAEDAMRRAKAALQAEAAIRNGVVAKPRDLSTTEGEADFRKGLRERASKTKPAAQRKRRKVTPLKKAKPPKQVKPTDAALVETQTDTPNESDDQTQG